MPRFPVEGMEPEEVSKRDDNVSGDVRVEFVSLWFFGFLLETQ